MVGGITRTNKRTGMFKDVYIRKLFTKSSLNINNGYVRNFYLSRTRCNYDLQDRFFRTNKTDFSLSKEIVLDDTKSIVAQISLFFD